MHAVQFTGTSHPVEHQKGKMAAAGFLSFFPPLLHISLRYAPTLQKTYTKMSTASQPKDQPTTQSSPGGSSSSNNNRGRGGARGGARGGRGGGGGSRGSDSPMVRLSKALSWLLRHNAAAQGVAIRSDGYVLIKDVLAHSKFKGYTVTQVMEVVDTNEKKRFQVLSDEQGNPEWIRAVQGHSLLTVTDPGLEPLLDASLIPDVVHGTMYSKWPLIGKKKRRDERYTRRKRCMVS